VAFAAVAGLAIVAQMGCSRATPTDVTIGHHRVRLVVPAGWEHLDHGREQIFRRAEMQMSIEDLGPADPKGMERELLAALQWFREGRTKDAFERVRHLRGPSLRSAASERRAKYWAPWYEVTRLSEPIDTFAVARAFGAMIENTRALDDVTPEDLVGYVLSSGDDRQRRTIGNETRRTLGNVRWIEAETWDTVTHLLPRRIACANNRGFLLVVSLDRDGLGAAPPAFEALLGSIRILPEEDAAPRAGVSARTP
jgi:hypothetical protein